MTYQLPPQQLVNNINAHFGIAAADRSEANEMLNSLITEMCRIITNSPTGGKEAKKAHKTFKQAKAAQWDLIASANGRREFPTIRGQIFPWHKLTTSAKVA